MKMTRITRNKTRGSLFDMSIVILVAIYSFQRANEPPSDSVIVF